MGSLRKGLEPSKSKSEVLEQPHLANLIKKSWSERAADTWAIFRTPVELCSLGVAEGLSVFSSHPSLTSTGRALNEGSTSKPRSL
jgi:hypothetical protein